MTSVDEPTRQWVGKSIPRKEDPRILAGRGTYVADVQLPGMLHAAVLRTAQPHARIVAIDTTAAEALDGVAAVLTGPAMAELIGPMSAFCAEPVEQRAIAIDKVRYPGEAVAAVAAKSRAIAEDACDLIEVTYEPLPALATAEEAMADDAPKLHDTLESNVVFQRTLRFGDVEADLARADRVIRRRLRWNRMGAQPIETAGAVASWDPFDETMQIWSNTNMYNYIGWSFAQMLDVAPNKLTMTPCLVGGSFGSKHLINKCISVAGALSKATRRPVSFLEDRVDNLAANDNVGPDRTYDAELAVTEEGEFCSLGLQCVDDYGAYFQFSVGQHGNALSQPNGPYKIPSLEYDLRAVLTNKVQQGFFRGAGADPGNFAIERLVDAAAEELGIDAIELRRRNFIQPDEFPYKIPTGNVYDSGDYPAVLDRALELADVDRWRAEQRRLREEEGRYIGVGLASCQERSGYSATEWWFWYDEPPFPLTSTPESMKLSVDTFGNFVATIGSPFWGNSPETVVSQVVAEEFGIRPQDVTVTYGDSHFGSLSAGPGGSRVTIMLSGAARGASRLVRDKMLRVAGHLLEIAPDDLELVDGMIRPQGESDGGMSIADVALKANLFKSDLPDSEPSGLNATFTYDHPYATDPAPDRSEMGVFYPFVSHACHIPIVEVDRETGVVRVLKYFAVNDCGTVMNPKLLEGQVIGGIVQGIGAALLEQYVYDDEGALQTWTWRDYLLPTVNDVPEITVVHHETPSPFTEYGVKGGGEGGRLVAPTALASAVEDALRPLGVRIDELPMTPERVVTWIDGADRAT